MTLVSYQMGLEVILCNAQSYIGLAKQFLWVFPWHFLEKLEGTFWPTQYLFHFINTHEYINK